MELATGKKRRARTLAYVLTKQHPQQASSIYITVDKAIELRNRKQETLCLFVPADLVDAAYSSLANSFAVIDGRTLHTRILRQIMHHLPVKAAQFVRATFSQLRGSLNASDDQKIDFALAIIQRTEADEMDRAGLELWRVGLITDASIGTLTGGELENKLAQNRRCTFSLARPTRIDATTRERVQNLKVDESTALKLNLFFKGRSLNNVQSWSRDLVQQEEELTFETWVFPESVKSDIYDIKIKPFVNAKGMVERQCKLLQPDGPTGVLIAKCAPKEKMVVSWTSEPLQPQNLGGWRVAIVPADENMEYEGNIELPERDLPMQRRSITLNMDIEFDELPDFAVCVRIVPINTDGTVITDGDGNEISRLSNEFYLSKDIKKPEISTPRESKFVVSNLAYGRLNYASETRDPEIIETEPQWSNRDLDYFNIKLNARRTMQVGISDTLVRLERQSIADSHTHYSYVLDVNDVHPVNVEDIASRPLPTSDNDIWTPLWKTRDLFFSRLKKSGLRDAVEVAEWSTELTGAAMRYAQAYRDLLERQADPQELREALSLDSILVRVTGRQQSIEEAIVVLPLHPLRVAWLVSYTQLLQTWEAKVLALSPRERKYNLDLQALQLLTPINVPPFAYHADTTTIFTFFQNLRFFHGVALPANITDPHRRYGDIAQIFGMAVDQGEYGDTHPEQLAELLKDFRDLHPYTHTLVTTLVNPDRGDFFAEALKKLLPTHKLTDDEEAAHEIPTFHITAYTDNRHKSTLQAIEQVR